MIEAKIVNNLTKEETVLKSETEYLPLPPIDGYAAYVGVEFGFSENLGNYRSAKGKVSIMYPCEPKSISDIYPKLKHWVEKRIEPELAEIQAYIDSKKVEI